MSASDGGERNRGNCDAPVRSVLGNKVPYGPRTPAGVAPPSLRRKDEWKCNDKTRELLDSIGLYDAVKSSIEDAVNGQKAYIIAMAKMRLDAISKAVSVIKAIDSGLKSDADDEKEVDDALSEIRVSLKR